jgi:hypothetical protein
MTPSTIVFGAGVWLVIVVGTVVWLAVVVLGRADRFGPRAIVRWFLSAWVPRIMILTFWGAAGWHIFCQRP